MDAEVVQESTNPSAPSFRADLVTLCAFLAGAFTTIWLPDRIEPQIFFGATLIMMSWNAWAYRSSFERRSVPRWQTSWIQMAIVTIVAGGVLYFVCRGTGAYHGQKSFEIFDKPGGHWLTVKLPTVLGQQIMLQLLLVPLLFRLFKKTRTTVLVGAFIFSALHFPNPVLVMLTFVAGSVWILVYSHSKQLAPIVVSHFALAILAAGLCGEYVLNMRIGPSCAALFPSQIGTGAESKLEFPNCIVGSVERLVQNGDKLILTGWVLDPIHAVAPTALYSANGDRLLEINQVKFTRVPATDWENAVAAGFVGQTCFSFVARIPATEATAKDGIRLMAANANGHIGQMGRLGDIQAIPNAPQNHSVLLFPVEVDGRINKVVQRADGLHLRGWAADLRHASLVDSLKLEFDNQIKIIDLKSKRHQRADLAKALEKPVFDQCGFDIHVGPIAGIALKNMRIFAIDQNQLLHPIQLTEHAEANVANLFELTKDRSVWR